MNTRAAVARIVTSLVGTVLVAYGVVAAVSPLPAGVPLIVLGGLMIAAANPAARPIIRRFRIKWHWFDVVVSTIGRRDPIHFKEVVDATEPPHDVPPSHPGEQKPQ
jgi:hypothetical protein